MTLFRTKNTLTSAADVEQGRRYFLGHCGESHGPAGGSGARGRSIHLRDIWHFPANELCYGNPMSYQHRGTQYIAVPIGDVLMAFGLD